MSYAIANYKFRSHMGRKCVQVPMHGNCSISV